MYHNRKINEYKVQHIGGAIIFGLKNIMHVIILCVLAVLLTPFSAYSQRVRPVTPVGPTTLTPPFTIKPGLTNPGKLTLESPSLPSLETNLPTVIYRDPQRDELRAVPVPPARPA